VWLLVCGQGAKEVLLMLDVLTCVMRKSDE
jgi:hypothetical protein